MVCLSFSHRKSTRPEPRIQCTKARRQAYLNVTCLAFFPTGARDGADFRILILRARGRNYQQLARDAHTLLADSNMRLRKDAVMITAGLPAPPPTPTPREGGASAPSPGLF